MSFILNRHYRFTSEEHRTAFIGQQEADTDEQLANDVIGTGSFLVAKIDESLRGLDAEAVTEIINSEGVVVNAEDYGQDYLFAADEARFFTLVPQSKEEADKLINDKLEELIATLDPTGSLYDMLDRRGIISGFIDAAQEVISE